MRMNMPTIEKKYKRLVKKCEKERLPFYKKKSNMTAINLCLVVSESAALLASITAVRDDISPLVVAPIVVVFAFYFIVSGWAEGKLIGTYIIKKVQDCSGKLEKEMTRKEEVFRIVGIVAIFAAVMLPLTDTALLRWVTRASTSGSISSGGSEIAYEATPSDNVLAFMLILIPLLAFLLETFLEIAIAVYDADLGGCRKAYLSTRTTEKEIMTLVGQIESIVKSMPDYDARVTELVEQDEAEYKRMSSLISSRAGLVSSRVAMYFMESKHLDCDSITAVQQAMDLEK